MTQNAINRESDTLWATTFDTNVAAAAVTLSGTTLAADGTDPNIPITLTPKGTEAVTIDGLDYPQADGTVGQVMQSDGAGVLSIGLLTVTGGGTGAASITDHALIVGSGTAAITEIGPLTNGQLVIGSTGVDPVAAALTAGIGISISVGAGSITIDSTATGLDYEDIVASPKAMEADHAYAANLGGGVAFSLPVTCAAGAVIEVIGKLGLWSVTQGAGQTIHVGNQSTTTGAGGSLTATNLGDCIIMRCIVADTDFRVQNMMGNLTVA